VTTWTFIWLMVLLKIPIVALFMIVRWAVRGPEAEGTPEEDGGIGPRRSPLHPHHPRSKLPRSPRRGPHGTPAPLAPARMRTATAHQRLPRN
jgi:hypothetical protein